MKIGVVVGKFQVPYITASQECLLNWAVSECDHLVVFVLEKEIEFSDNNPVPLAVRVEMLKQALTITSNYSIIPLREQKYSASVCADIDSELLDRYNYSKDEFTIFSGKDGFAKYYKGICNIRIKEFPGNITSKALRKYANEMTTFCKESIAGMIKAVTYKPSICYNYVVSIIKVDKSLVVVKSPGSKLLKFPTIALNENHSSLQDASLENVQNFLKGDVNKGYHMGAIKVDDWRFRESRDYCYYHLIHHIAKDSNLFNCQLIERPFQVDNFESEYEPIINYLNSFTNAR